MTKNLPDKYIRKGISDLLNNLNVDGQIIKCYDTRVTGPHIPDHYIIMSTQTAEVDKDNKCEWFWDSSILLDITTNYQRQGNTGSRLLVDNITDEVRNQMNSLSLDGGFTIVTQTQSYPNDITTITENEIVYRKFLRLQLLIK